MRRSLLASIVLAALGGTGCNAHDAFPVPHGPEHPEPPAPVVSYVNVGAARADITPPPGVTTFGHGPDALVTDGYWTRLYCRVFAFETVTNEPGSLRMAVAACELPAMSALLQRTVADQVSDLLPPTRVMLSATHTHAGPGHYFDGIAYGGLLSTRLPAFDPAMLHFLADRISAAIRSAFANATRASLRWTHYDPWLDAAGAPSPAPTSANDGLWGLAWNRTAGTDIPSSYVPHLPTAPTTLTCRAEQRIDPALHVLRIDAVGSHRPIGVLTFLSMHPTVLPNTNRLLGSDVFGVVSRDVEGFLRARSAGDGDPLGAIINGNEGDVAPKWRDGSKPEAIALGHDVASRIIHLVQGLPSPEPDPRTLVGHHYLEVDLPRYELGTIPADARNSTQLRTCYTPELGETFDFGACDHPTTDPVRIPTLDFRDSLCQSPKRVKGGFLEHLLAGNDFAFPGQVPMASARIGDSLITFVPGEFTVRAGRYVAERALEHYPRPPSGVLAPSHSFIAGLSNAYILYVATREEFLHQDPRGGCAGGLVDDHPRQTYEGSATLYGPNSMFAFAEGASRLAAAFSGTRSAAVDSMTAVEFRTGAVRERFPRPNANPIASTDRAPRFACQLAERDVHLVCFAWTDAAPAEALAPAGPWVRLLERRADRLLPIGVGLSANHPEFGSAPLDDTAFDLVTRVVRLHSNGADWVSLLDLTPEVRAALKGKAVSLVAMTREEQPSVAFEPKALDRLPECTADQRADCGSFDDPPPAHPPMCDACAAQCR